MHPLCFLRSAVFRADVQWHTGGSHWMCQRADVFLDQCVYKGWGAGSQRRRASTAEEERNKYGKSFFSFLFVSQFKRTLGDIALSHPSTRLPVESTITTWKGRAYHERQTDFISLAPCCFTCYWRWWISIKYRTFKEHISLPRHSPQPFSPSTSSHPAPPRSALPSPSISFSFLCPLAAHTAMSRAN